MNTLTEQLAAMNPTFSEWKPDGITPRFYINASIWAEKDEFAFLLAGVRVSFHNSGNIAKAERWDEDEQAWEGLSNTKARNYAGTRVWVEEGDRVLSNRPVPREVVEFVRTLWKAQNADS